MGVMSAENLRKPTKVTIFIDILLIYNIFAQKFSSFYTMSISIIGKFRHHLDNMQKNHIKMFINSESNMTSLDMQSWLRGGPVCLCCLYCEWTF